MKKSIVFAVFFCVLRYTAYTQTTKPQAPVKTGNEWKMPSDVFRRAKTYSADLQKKLRLDTSQTKKVYELFLANTKPLDEISVATVSDKEKASMRKTNQDTFNENMKGILSLAQYQKYIVLNK